MDRKNEESLSRLRETFRVEATEHLDAVTAGLLAMEHASDADRAAKVEHVFREAHSLRGAARSLSLAGVEALCLELESVFAAVRREELGLSTETCDGIRAALGVLAKSCASAGAPSSPKGLVEEQQAIAALRRVAHGTVDPLASGSAVVAPPRPPVVGTPPALVAAPSAAAPDPPEQRTLATSAASDRVCVSTQKLGAILLEAEELVGSRIAAGGRAAALCALAADLADWNQRRAHETARRRQGEPVATTGSELLASEMHYLRGLESSLCKTARAALQDTRDLAAIVDRLQEETRQLLLLPCSYLFGTLPKVLRDLAREQGKEIELLVGGEDIEIDRRILDELKEPLLHLLRNCVDYGFERPDARRALGKPGRGSVTITASPVEGNRVALTVADDGSGIDAGQVRQAAAKLGLVAADDAAHLADAEVIGLVFCSGLSTSSMSTDSTGRGLGLAIVREKVEKLGGTVTVTSTPGGGTAFRLLVPSSLAAFRGVFVAVAGQRFVVPTASVVRVCRIEPAEIKTVENRQAIALGARAVPLLCLRDVLELTGPEPSERGSSRPVVVLRAADREVAFLVDRVEGEQEVRVKPLAPQLARVRHVSGASISGSGAVVPILDVAALVETASTAGAPRSGEATDDTASERRGRLLIAEDSITARTLVKSILEGAGYEVVATVDGMDALTRLKTEFFDLLVSDVDMPRLNGFELTARIRADQKLNARVHDVLANQELRRGGPSEVGINVFVAGQRFFVTADRLQILVLLLSSYEDAVQRSRELVHVRDELQALNEQLESRVRERTAALAAELEERTRMEVRTRLGAAPLRRWNSPSNGLLDAPQARGRDGI
ncbi:MAG: chemotaxis protein CheW, partial [Polyangiaceae bacterium]|nr:chemotaxis protein CheW [Polyangiaceae bacterium]